MAALTADHPLSNLGLSANESDSDLGRARIAQQDTPEVDQKDADFHAHSSALDVEDSGSLDLPYVPPTTERIRRRSELPRSFSRAVDTPSRPPEFIELAMRAASPAPPPYAQSSAVAPGLAAKSEASLAKISDVEVALDSLPASSGVSVFQSEDAGSTAPIISASQKAIHTRNSRIQFAALCYALFLEGWNDGSTGPLLPTIQSSFGIGFAIVSLLFVFNTVGFISGALANVYLDARLGLGKVLVIGAAIQLVGYALMAPGKAFPLMCLAFCLAGFGISLQNAQANGYVGSLKENTRIKFGFLHASYGLGAFVAPLVATHFSTQPHWSYHYLISASIAVTNTIVLWAVFRLERQSDVLSKTGQAPAEVHTATGNQYGQILGIREVHFLSVFALIYVGTEVTLGGWIVTFVQEKRGGNASSGYISAGFFGGLMSGRILLMWLNRKIGERRIMFIYAFIAIALEVTIWVVPSLIENAVAVSFIGLLLGPMYPILMNHSTSILPKWILTGCIGYIAGFGQAGSAVLPFLTGVLASRFGIGSLQPFIVSMMSTLICIWAIVPRARRFD